MGLSASLGSVGAVLGGIGEYQGAKRAVRGQEQATDYMMRQRAEAQAKANELYGEYLPAGGFGMDALQRQYDILVGGDMSKFQESPGYQFAMEEGTKALERGAAAQGGLLGGRQMKELTRFGQGLASQDFGNYLQQLSGIASQGINTGLQGAGGIMGQYGGVSGAQVAQGLMGIGNAKAFKQSSPWQTAANVANIWAEDAAGSQGAASVGGVA